jgi:hypothetical protein
MQILIGSSAGNFRKGRAIRPRVWLGWSRRQESNLYLALRRHSFYPLNYGEQRERQLSRLCHKRDYSTAFGY